MKKMNARLLAGVMIAGLAIVPVLSLAQERHDGGNRDWNHSQSNGTQGDRDQYRRDDQRRRDDHRRQDDARRRDNDRGRSNDRRENDRRDNDRLREEMERRRRDEERRRIEDQRRRDEEWRRNHYDRNGYDWERNGRDRDWRNSSGRYDYGYDRYRDDRNEWRNIATVLGGIAILGALEHDDRLVFGGTAGALYSIYRYDEDRRSNDRLARLRAEYFSRPYFYRDGRRYTRYEVNRSGQRYYQFRCD